MTKKYAIKINDKYYFYGRYGVGPDLTKAMLYTSLAQIKAAYNRVLCNTDLLNLDAADADLYLKQKNINKIEAVTIILNDIDTVVARLDDRDNLPEDIKENL